MEQAVAGGVAPSYAPPSREPIRVAFVGQGTFFQACALDPGHPWLQATFVEFRKDADLDAMLARLADIDPHVAIVFRPEIVPAGAFHDLKAVTVGFLTEPLPRTTFSGVSHDDLERRLWELRLVDASNFDRIVAFDPFIVGSADGVLPVWRSVPLPVADRYFMAVKPMASRPRALFIGRSTPHREELLIDAKHNHDVLHIAFGVGADDLRDLLESHDVGINVHNNPYPSFENRVCLHLAAGQLVISEPLSPSHGLERGLDYLQFEVPAELEHALASLERFHGLWDDVRLRGRRKAEQFRASRVYPRLVDDLFRDLAAFGSPRR